MSRRMKPLERDRQFEFDPTPAVLSARNRGPFIPCPACAADNERYLFHKGGVRFVSCRSCGVVYSNPPALTDPNYFDVSTARQHLRQRDRDLYQNELTRIATEATSTFAELQARPPKGVLIVGRTLSDGPKPSELPPNTEVLRLDQSQAFRLISEADVTTIVERISSSTEVLILNELLEACPISASVAARLVDAMPQSSLVVVIFSNVSSLPARLMRRHWPRFFAWKSVYFDTDNLTRLMDRSGLRLVKHQTRRTPYTISYVLERLTPTSVMPRWLDRIGIGGIEVRLPAGTCVATFEKPAEQSNPEVLSVIIPVYNEVRYVALVLEAVLNKQLAIPKQVVVVESNSTDGTRAVLQRYEGTPGLEIIYEDRPRGKGAAVQRGLAVASGSIMLIQDADFEYDLDDYDALIEPILQRRTSFVLGSRSLGLDDWKVRKYSSSRVKALLMNVAQVIFAKTFNVLYQQQTTDVNTMFKVFRRECIDGIDFEGRGFNFDIELVCRIVANGFAPMEIPVNYVARSFDEGKKINFLTDFFSSYAMFYRCRLRRVLPG